MAKVILWMCGRRCTWNKFLTTVVVATVFFNEYLIYVLNSLYWPALPIKDRDPVYEQVILLVSDPQLIGNQDEPGFPLGQIIRWDSDRYIQHNFALAYHYAKPDLVIFLGDLMDEGSKATKSEYSSYLQRFHNIFSPAKSIKKIYLPGDNDIGGEGRDRRNEFKMERFTDHFESIFGAVKFGFIDFLKLDIRTQESLKNTRVDEAKELSHRLSSPLKIVINHESVLMKDKFHIFPVFRHIRPNLIISGHWHKATLFSCADCMVDDSESWLVNMRDLTNETGYTEINVKSEKGVTEIMVPTCSYRMGVENIGYGIVVISSTGNMKYTTLWLPQRYIVLYSYLYILVTLVVIRCVGECVVFFAKRNRRPNKPY